MSVGTETWKMACTGAVALDGRGRPWNSQGMTTDLCSEYGEREDIDPRHCEASFRRAVLEFDHPEVQGVCNHSVDDMSRGAWDAEHRPINA